MTLHGFPLTFWVGDVQYFVVLSLVLGAYLVEEERIFGWHETLAVIGRSLRLAAIVVVLAMVLYYVGVSKSAG